MALKAKQTTAKKEPQAEKVLENHELIPYACHLNPQTVVTKNAELIQFIKIPSSAGLSDDNFRLTLREIINENIDPEKIAIWIHTTRSQKQLNEAADPDFVNHIDILWKQVLPDELRYANTIYLSIVIDFKRSPLWQPQNFLRALVSRLEEGRFNRIMEERNAELMEIADNILNDLQRFGATRLEMVNRNGVYYSEPMEFLHKLVTFIDEPMPVPFGNISTALYKEKFLFNLYKGQLVMTNKFGNYYGVLISLKETKGLTAAALQDILNTGYEFIISESIDFSFANKKIRSFQHQKYINSLTEDKKFYEIMGGDKVEAEPQNFALSQTNIMIMRKTPKELNEAVKKIHTRLNDMGLISYVEDIRLEKSFWAMLPGNFSFLRRQNLVARDEIATFASLGADKFTSIEGNMFSEPLTFFETADGEAFSLHFLAEGQSNILIAGGIPEERQVVANLLAAQAARLGVDVIFYDTTGHYRNFANSINAAYMDTLDLEAIKDRISEKTVIVFNTFKNLLNEDNFDFVFNFLDYAASKNAMVIVCADYEDNCEALLPNFRSQIYMHGSIEKYADHFDFFEDEIRIVELLEPDSFYFKHDYLELVLTFKPTEKLVRALLGGAII